MTCRRPLVTGAATGLVGSHVARGCSSSAATTCASTVRASVARSTTSRASTSSWSRADVLDRARVRRALRGVDRVFHVAGLTSLRAGADDALPRQRRRHARSCSRRRCAPASSASSTPRRSPRSGPAPRGSTADETQVFRAGRFGLPYVNAKHEAESEALRIAAHGLPVVIVNPAHVFGRGDVHRSSTELVRRFLRREIPAYVDGALNVVDAEDVARGHLLADERGVVGERYILGNRNFTLDRLFADLGRLSAASSRRRSSCRSPAALALARAARGAARPAADHRRRGPRASLWWAFRSTKAKRELGWKPSPPRGHAGSTRSTGTASASRSSLARRARASRCRCALAGFGLRQAGGVARAGLRT